MSQIKLCAAGRHATAGCRAKSCSASTRAREGRENRLRRRLISIGRAHLGGKLGPGCACSNRWGPWAQTLSAVLPGRQAPHSAVGSSPKQLRRCACRRVTNPIRPLTLNKRVRYGCMSAINSSASWPRGWLAPSARSRGAAGHAVPLAIRDTVARPACPGAAGPVAS